MQHLNLTDALYANIALWAVVVVATMIWRIFGLETGGGRSVSVSSAE